MGEKTNTLIDCNSTIDQLALANYHSIPEAAFEGYLYNYWGDKAEIIEPVIVPWADLEAQMLDKDCNTTCWKLVSNHTDTDTNTIALGFQELEPGGLPPEYQPNITYYSFALFKGAQLKDGATEFHFYKAQYSPPESKYAVIFQTMSDEKVVLGYYNLSNSYPIELPKKGE
jgi:hypothetical protein